MKRATIRFTADNEKLLAQKPAGLAVNFIVNAALAKFYRELPKSERQFWIERKERR